MARTGSARSRWRTAATAVAATACFGLLAVTGVAGTGSSGDPAPAAFRLDDGSAGCNFLGSGEIACRAIGSPDALVLEPDGDVRIDDLDVIWDDATPALGSAESWWHGGFSCSAADGRLACSTASGGVVEVGPEGAAGAAPPALVTQS